MTTVHDGNESVANPVLTSAALSALARARPWFRFLTIYGYLLASLLALACIASIVWGFLETEFLILGLNLLLWSAIAFLLLQPLRRSSAALRRLSIDRSTDALESYAIAQSHFWRLTGAITAFSLAMGLLGTLLGLILVIIPNLL
jgi:hypothetical protein